MTAPPLIDARTGEQIVEQGKTLAAEYTPDWIPREGDRGLALLSLFGRLMEIVLSRLNRVPEKSFLAFLDTAGITLLPPKAARAPVRFVAADGAPDDGIAPEGTRIATAPRDGGEPSIFESEKSLVVHRARMTRLFSHDPLDDTYGDRGNVLAANEKNENMAFEPFAGSSRIPHRLHLAHNTLFNIGGPASVTLIFTVDSVSTAVADLFQHGLTWKIRSSGEKDVTPPASNITLNPAAGTITVVLNSALLNAIDASTIDGVSGHWVAVETKEPLSQDEANLSIISVRARSEATNIGPGPAFCNTMPLDTAREFHPFGERPKCFDTFFLSVPEAFSKEGSRITLQPAYRKGTAGPGGVELTYEFWNGTAWEILGVTNDTGTVAGAANDAYDFEDATNAFTADSGVSVTIRFDCPAIRPTDVNGRKNRWIRARITRGNYGEDAKMVRVDTTPPPTLDKWEYAGPTFAPPIVLSFTASYAYQNDQPVTACKTENNFSITTIDPAGSFRPFTASAESQPACYFGLDRPLSPKPVCLFIAVEESPLPVVPAVVWEYWGEAGWKNLGIQDGTRNFTESGVVEFMGPADAAAEGFFGAPKPLFWLRARLDAGEKQAIKVLGVYLNTVWTRNCATVRNEIAGSSTEAPDAEFALSRFPVLEDFKIDVREPDRPSEEELAVLRDEEKQEQLVLPERSSSRECWVRWHRVDHFRCSGRRSRHYVIDWKGGRIRFGNGIHGMIPPAGRENVRAAWYRSGGGAQGKAARNAVTVLKRSIPFVEKAFNVDRADGGSDVESAASAMVRGPQAVKHRGRAVTFEDYEWLAKEASFQVARAKCLGARTKDDAGTARLIIVPWSDEPKPMPSQGLIRQVKDHLNTRERRIGTANLSVNGPQYEEVSVQATVFPERLEEADLVRRRVREHLTAFFHPLAGGPDGTGWEFGRDVYVSEVCKVIEDTDGVHHAEDVTLSSTAAGLFGVDHVPIPDNALVASGGHAVGVSSSPGPAGSTSAASVAAMAAPGYLGNANSRELHDLGRIRPQCQIDRILPEHRLMFLSVEEARSQGYDLCGWCFGPGASTR